MNLTNVVFTFYDSKGDPIADTPFTIQLIRSGFDKQVGVVVPTIIEVATDGNGQATVALAPSSTPYYVRIDGLGHCGKQSYKFYVPEYAQPVNFQDLIAIDELDPAVITDEKIKLILEAMLVSKDSAAAAKVSEDNAKLSEEASALSESNSKASEEATKLAQIAAQGSADSALASMNAAKDSETNAKTSENNSKASETASKASETSAKASELNTKASEVTATGAAFTATNEAGKAAASASAAKASEVASKASEELVTTLKGSVELTAVHVDDVKVEMDSLLAQAQAIGSGWSPVMQVVPDGSRYVLQIVDWTGGNGTKPEMGYMGPTGIVETIGTASDIRGAKGIDGKSFTVNATGTLVEKAAYDSAPEGFAYLATDNGLLYIREGAYGWSPGIPFGKGDKGDTGERGPQGVKGDKGDVGATGDTGPANTLKIGTVSSGASSSATITGTAPNQTLNLVLQKGDQGEKGDTGLGFTQAQYEKLDGIEAGAQKNVASNLSAGTPTATTFVVNNDNGTGVTIPAATTTQAGLLQAADKVKLDGAAPTESPALTGNPTATIQDVGDNSSRIATTSFVKSVANQTFTAVPAEFQAWVILVTQPHLRQMVWSTTKNKYVRAPWHPVGKAGYFLREVGEGFLQVRGDVVLQTADFPDLAEYLSVTGPTFVLDEARAEFIRNADSGRGKDVGRVVGSHQGDAGRNLTGSIVSRLYAGGTGNSNILGAGDGGAFLNGGNTGPKWINYINAGDVAGTQNTYAVRLDASTQWPTADEFRVTNRAYIFAVSF